MSIFTATLNPCIDKTFSIERMISDRKLTGSNIRDYPGGGGINVARAISRFDFDVRALWSCGGEIGQRLLRLLNKEKILHDPIPIDGEIRENIIIQEDSTGEQYRFGMPGPTLTDEDRNKWISKFSEIPLSSRYLVVSGSLPGGTSPDWYEQLLDSVPDGIKLVVDTKKEALRRALQVGVYLIKPNVSELEELFGRGLTDDNEIEKAAREIIQSGGAKVVIISLGRGGALLVTGHILERFSAPSVPLKSKVGAGDSMVGGLVAALAREFSLEDAVKFGVAAGTAAVMTEGTELCRKEDTERLFDSVRCQEVA